MIVYEHDFTIESSAERETRMAQAHEQLLHEHDSGKVGYYELPKTSQLLAAEVKEFEGDHPLLGKEGEITDIAVIGIGGSSLGIKAVDALLGAKEAPVRTLHFFENSDPVSISRTMAKLERERTFFIVISKSGGTIETISIFKTLIAHFELDLDDADNDRIAVITDEGSALSRFADAHDLVQFHIPKNVGGRFSVLSAVGVVPLVFAGYDVASLLRGAGDLIERMWIKEADHLLRKALFLATHREDHGINVLFSYADDLHHFTKWYVQLWGESLGKIDAKGQRMGMTPVGLIGAVDQHSFLQLLIEGPLDKTVTFIRVADFDNDLRIPELSLEHIEKTDFVNGKTFTELINAQCEATRESLRRSGVPTDTIVLDRIDAEHVGELIAYFELLTSLTGAMLGIDTYNQPGVELGKRILYDTFKKDADT